jgi:uncharacterized protein (DUF58 family)
VNEPLPAQRFRLLPGLHASHILLIAAAAAIAARILGMPAYRISEMALTLGVVGMALALSDILLTWRAWRATELVFERLLPMALALGVNTPIEVRLSNRGPHAWRGELFDQPGAPLEAEGLPLKIHLDPQATLSAGYRVRAQRRGDVSFAPALLRLRSRFGWFGLDVRCGHTEQRRVFPNFVALARFAWLSGNRRLAEIGIKAIRQRGTGTDFKQLNEYQPGDPVRHIDWRASQRLNKPVVRQFQDERDQRVLLLLDCGRRMRADDRDTQRPLAHFDQVLNAVLLLAYVALRHGDYFGAMTFGHAPGEGRAIAPARGIATLQRIMSELYALRPSLEQSDYLVAARDLMNRLQKRALIVVVTNFRDEDEGDLRDALRLLRTRHLVLLASLEEEVVGELIAQPLVDADVALDIAGAQFYRQQRAQAFLRLAANDTMMIDTRPGELGVQLVNRYNAVKRAGLL